MTSWPRMLFVVAVLICFAGTPPAGAEDLEEAYERVKSMTDAERDLLASRHKA